MLYVQPTSGLCNRLRAIQSAYELSQRTGQELVVVWKCDGGMNIPAECIFNIKTNPKIITFKYNSSCKFLYILKRLRFEAFQFFMKHRKDFLFLTDKDVCKILEESNRTEFQKIIKKHKNVYIQTFSDLTEIKKCDLFIPSEQVLSRVSEVKSYCNIDKDTIGVHIRRTDNKESILHSPTQLFEQKMTEELKRNPKTKFYLATDSYEEEQKLAAKFGSAIMTFKNKDTSRTTFQGQIDAYAELLILSQCKELWGSYFSSFSDIAAIIGQIHKEIIKDN